MQVRHRERVKDRAFLKIAHLEQIKFLILFRSLWLQLGMVLQACSPSTETAKGEF